MRSRATLSDIKKEQMAERGNREPSLDAKTATEHSGSAKLTENDDIWEQQCPYSNEIISPSHSPQRRSGKGGDNNGVAISDSGFIYLSAS